MTATMTKTNPRVTVENGWAVRNLDDGSQVRARLIHDPYHPEPERGRGMWNEGVSLVRERDGYGGTDLDDHDGLRRVLMDRIAWCQACLMHVVTREHDELPYRPDADCSWHAASDVVKDREEFVRRYLRAFWDVQHVSLRHHSGYSQSDWADIWVIVEGVEEGANVDALADATWEEWDAWAKGDIYSIEVETRTLTDAMCAAPNDPDDGWEHDEEVGGYYGDEGARDGLVYALGVDEADVPALWDLPMVRERY